MNKFCDICPRHCGVDRNKSVGFCNATNKLEVAHVGLHFWEEPCISGTSGSGTIFFSHCNLKCVFCQNANLRDGKIGKQISVEHLVEIFKRLETLGAHNINLVSPSHYSLQIVEALKLYKPKIPIVWNSNGYESIQTINFVAPFVDVFLVDLKYFDGDLSTKLAKCPNYFEIASKAILKMRELKPIDTFKNGIMTSGVVVRHLCLPNHTEDSIKIVDFLAKNLRTTMLSLMSQYVPYDKAKEMPDIARPLKKIEYNKVLHHAKKLLEGTIFAQDMSSSSEQYIPNWKPEEV